MMMKLKSKLAFFMLALLLFSACEKEEVMVAVEPHQVVLLTDYTSGSDVLISIEGRLKSRYPDIIINYIEADAFNVVEASYQLQIAAENYPEGSFFMALVEPGASSERMVFKTDKNQTFVVPDNTISSRLFHTGGIPDCYQIENAFACSQEIPDDLNYIEVYTFALIDLIEGRDPAEFGSRIENPEVFEIQDAHSTNGILYGQIISTDNFGNCISNISGDLLQAFNVGDLLEVSYDGGTFFTSLGDYYSSVPMGQNVVFKNSLGKVELAVNYGDLTNRYPIAAGSFIQISKKSLNIGMLQFNSHSDQFVEEVKTQISALGMNANYIVKNAEGDFGLMETLIQELVNEEVDIIIPFSTPAAQAAVLHVPETIPLVYTVVTDPESAGIIEGRNNCTGLSDASDQQQFFQFVKQILPQLKIVGSIYNDLESNSVFAQEKMHQMASLFQLSYFSETADTQNEMINAYQNIRDKEIQAILISDDNFMADNCNFLVDLALSDSIPVFGTAIKNTKNGALASLSIDYKELCSSTADVVVSVVRGQNPDDIHIKYFETKISAINKTTADKLGITIPEDILENANYTFE